MPGVWPKAWNKEYEQAGADVQENLRNWAKQQEADLAEVPFMTNMLPFDP